AGLRKARVLLEDSGPLPDRPWETARRAELQRIQAELERSEWKEFGTLVYLPVKDVLLRALKLWHLHIEPSLMLSASARDRETVKSLVDDIKEKQIELSDAARILRDNDLFQEETVIETRNNASELVDTTIKLMELAAAALDRPQNWTKAEQQELN